MAGITAIKRKGFAGGGKDASTSSFDKGATSKGPNPSRPDTKEYGATDFQVANQGFTPTQIENQNVGNLDGDDYYTAQKEFEYNVNKRKLKRPEDDFFGPREDYPGSLYYTGVPKSNIPYLKNYLNMAAPFRNKMLRKNIDYFLGLKSRNPNLKYEDTLEGYKDYMSDRLSGSITASGNTIYNAGGNNYSTNRDDLLTVMPDETITEDDKFTYRMGDEQNVGADVTQGYYAANGGRITRAGGGIMNAVPRQGYFLGGIGKSIGKAFKGVAKAAGKVLKSDFGKMALLAAGAYYMPGYGIKATGGFSNMMGADGFFKTAGKKLLLKDGMNFGDKNALSLGKILGLSAALPFIPGINKVPENEDIGMGTRGGSLIDPLTGKEAKPAEMRASLNEALDSAGGDPDKIKEIQNAYAFLGPDQRLGTYLPYETYGVKDGGRIRAQEGGLMNLGGMEKDYRNEGGFVPIGKQEKADDVPARLSVNEFVFTADAVRNAGGGDIDKGAEVMENMMKNLENGGRVSEESQGNTGAQRMFSVSERIGEVI